MFAVGGVRQKAYSSELKGTFYRQLDNLAHKYKMPMIIFFFPNPPGTKRITPEEEG